MNKQKHLFFAPLFFVSIFALSGCTGTGEPAGNTSSEEPEPDIAEVVKSWSSMDDFDLLPLETPNTSDDGRGDQWIAEDFGRKDKCSLSYELLAGYDGSGYISSYVPEERFFVNGDAVNGYIISLFVYVPEGGNVSSFQLQALSTNYADELYGLEIEIGEDDENKWKRATVSFDSVDEFKALRLHYTVKDREEPARFTVDDINIIIGTPTVEESRVAEESLYKLYEDDFKIGTCLSSRILSNAKVMAATKENFNSITAENEGKPEQILDQAGCQALLRQGDSTGVAIKTDTFDGIYRYAEANHMRVRHHTFVWYSQTPSWFFTTNYTNNGPAASRDVMLARMENFIRTGIETINDLYPGLVYAIDVANEAIENGGVRRNSNKWYDTVGNDFVYYAMKYAHEYKADYQDLYYNDYSFDYYTNSCTFALNTLLKDAISEGLVDGVGIQGHLDSNANMENIISDAKLIYAKGLKCQITELDITVNDQSAASYAKQKSAYKTLMTKILNANEAEQIDVNAVILWGVTDDMSWKRNQHPLVFDSNCEKKPAYYGMFEAKAER